ncbi:MAG: translation initiation factor IF-2 N-terminal domain-containing protein [Labilithrix sp.]|nr:translation initiation factor IF-2 N-terminal domain-containing protein [Labilithrix sp.]MCW5814415.1 translation initiation factor IF-2 N-terminal domain-containing protein [Labilithrix sp.]
MSDQPPDADNDLTALSTVLNRVRPTVVVRRRVYEVAQLAAPAPAMLHVAPDDDDDGPPSSVNVARALASLRGDELRRLEEILTADEEPAPPSVKAAPPPESEPTSARTVPVGETITVPELARRMGVATQDLVTTLVAAGYFSTTAKSVLTRANATTAAWMFGWQVAPIDDEPKPKKTNPTKRKR